MEQQMKIDVEVDDGVLHFMLPPSYNQLDFVEGGPSSSYEVALDGPPICYVGRWHPSHQAVPSFRFNFINRSIGHAVTLYPLADDGGGRQEPPVSVSVSRVAQEVTVERCMDGPRLARRRLGFPVSFCHETSLLEQSASRLWLLENGKRNGGGDDADADPSQLAGVPQSIQLTLFSGGRFHIPQTKEQEFLRVYAEDLCRGIECCYNEIANPQRPFRFFLDVDCSPPEARNLLVGDVGSRVRGALRGWFAEAHCRVVVLYKGCEGTRDWPSSLLLSYHHHQGCEGGLHILCPHLLVDRERASQLATSLAPVIMAGKTTKPDLQVYSPSPHLRMPGSYKWGICQECRDEWQRDDCRRCGGSGKGRIGCSYRPVRGEWRNWLEVLECCCIQLGAAGEGEAPTPLLTPLTVDVEPSLHQADAAINGAPLIPIPPTDRRYACCSRLLVEGFKGFASGSENRITLLFLLSPGCYQAKTNSRYCELVGRLHRSSTTYYLIRREGIEQLCYGKKECRHRRSEMRPLPLEAAMLLFPCSLPIPCSAGAASAPAVLARMQQFKIYDD